MACSAAVGDAGGPGWLGTRLGPAEAWHEVVGGGGMMGRLRYFKRV